MTNNMVISLTDAQDAYLVGSKGYNLRALAAHGLPVPWTHCVTRHAYALFIETNNLRSAIQAVMQDGALTAQEKSHKITELIGAGHFPLPLSEALDACDFGGHYYAVRSSSDMEDLPGRSFAGIYESYLNLQGAENIKKGMQKCWASLWSERAIVYREKYKICHEKVSMPIIIQAMVDATYSGILFTEQPGGEKSGTMYLEYCMGLGDALASGAIDPFRCTIDKSCLAVSHLNLPQGTRLNDSTILRLAELALKAEEYFDCPQDIEWAMDENRIYILQSRPIHVGGRVIALHHIWTRANIGEVLPNVVTPLTWDVFRATLSNSTHAKGNKPEDIEKIQGIALKQGRAYVRLDRFLDSFCYLPAVTPGLMADVLGVRVPEASADYSAPAGLAVRIAQIVFLLDALRIFPRLHWLVRKNALHLPRDSGDLHELLTWTTNCFRAHIKCTAYAIGCLAVLSSLLKRWIPSRAADLLPEILMGEDDMQTSAQGASLWRIAQHVRADSALHKVFLEDAEWSIMEERLACSAGGREFLRELQEFFRHNGSRAAGEFELSIPRWRENPAFICKVLRKYLHSDGAAFHNKMELKLERRARAVGHIKKSLSLPQRMLFSRFLSSYSVYVTLRENVKYRLMEGYALLRRSLLATGDQMAHRGLLTNAEDIFYLKMSEVSAFMNGHDSDGKETVAERKKQNMLWNAEIAPAVVIDDQSDGLSVSDIVAEVTLQGIGCSHGVAAGYARVLFDTGEMDLLRDDEILVTPHTDPGWTPLFLVCKALVTEIGGFLSHGATVAREYGVPAVANVQNATTMIQTGDFIHVDGTRGVIKILERK